MIGFLDDRAVAQRVLDHVRDATTDRGEKVWREPVANYTSDDRFAQEISVLRRSPTPFCPSAALAEPGAHVARVAAGTPILAVRGDDGRVRAFRNACRHRGMPLAAGAGCARAFVCRYHGWTYRLDGSLRHVPHEDGFPGLDKDEHGLTPVLAWEHAGIVFVQQDGAPIADPAPWEGLPEAISACDELLETREGAVEVNWKVFLEGFLEGYHIRPAHRDTFYPYGYDNLNVVECSGRNSRVTFPFRRIEKLADVPASRRSIDGRVTYVYHLFPNALVTVLSRHTNLVVIEPIDVGRSRLVTWAMARTNGDPAVLEEAKRDASFVNETGAAEDLEIVLAIQRSIRSRANEYFTFGHFEKAIVHFHENLHAALRGPAAEPPRGR